MPALSPTMEEGGITSWLKQPGDRIEPGDILCEVETDKAVVGYESVEEGWLAAITQGSGAQIQVGETIGWMVEEEGEIAAAQAAAAAKATESPVAPATPATPQETKSSTPTPTQAHSREKATHFTPAVYMLLKGNNLDPTSIQGTGRKGMLLKGDVLAAISAGTTKALPASPATSKAEAAPLEAETSTSASATPNAQASFPRRSVGRGLRSHEDLPITKMRKVIATRLSQSKADIPHHYVSSQINIDGLMQTRKDLINNFGVKLSVNDFIVRATALALDKVPEVNVIFQGGKPQQSPTVDISIAVATPTGLITPIIANANHKRLTEISSETKALAGKAKEGTLQPNEFMGGSFTISNLGMFGVKEFKAIINMPQACIMAVGGGQTVVKSTGEDDQDIQLQATTDMLVSLSCDERAIDANDAARFLQVFKGYIEQPQSMIL